MSPDDQAPEEPISTPTPEPEAAAEPVAEEAPVAEPAPEPAPAVEEPAPAVEPAATPLFASSAAPAPVADPAAAPAKKSHTGLIIGIIAAVVVIAAVLIVLFAVILPNANKGDDKKKDDNTSKQDNKDDNGGGNGGSDNGGGNGGSDNGGGNGGNGGNNGGGSSDSKSIVGKYELYSAIDAEGNEDTSSVAFIKAFANMTIEFKSDGTGVMKVEVNEEMIEQMGGDTSELEDQNSEQKFTYKDGKITVIDEEGELQDGEYELSSDGKYVTVTASGQGMKFKRM